MITNSSRIISGRTDGVRSHSSRTISPQVFNKLLGGGYLTKQAHTLMRAKGYEIAACTGVIEIREAKGAALETWMLGHASKL